MKVLYIVNNINQTTGVQHVICNLSNYFSEKSNYNVVIHSLTSSGQLPFFSISPLVTIIHHSIDWRTLTRTKILTTVHSIMSETDADIIITANATISDAAILCKKASNAKVIITEHCEVTNYSKKRRWLNNLLYPFADKVVMLTKNDCTFYRHKNIISIPNAVPFTSQLSTSLDSKTLISIGRLELDKGYDMLLHAFKIVHNSCPNWTLRILGEGTQRSMLEHTISKLNLNDFVELPGFVKDIPNELRSASINIISSRTEGLPLAALEAMECGLPSVVFSLPAFKEVFTTDQAVFVPCNDINKLAQEIISLISDKKRMIQMSENAKIHSKNYHIDSIGKKWEALFEELITN